MNTPVFDTLLSDVLGSVHVARERLATVRTGVDRLHAPDERELCPLCREAWPCATRQLVDGTARGELDAESAVSLVDAAVALQQAQAERPEAEHGVDGEGEGEGDGEDSHRAEGPERLGSLMPSVAELLQGGRTSRALDALLGGDRLG